MVEFKNAAEAARLNQLVREAERKKSAERKGMDKWGLPPVRKGWVRGHVMALNAWDEPCEFGVLQVLEFELREDPKVPGIPVRMAGTYFDARIMEGNLLDVRDPKPSVRPIQAPYAIFSGSLTYGTGRAHLVKAYYPGRDAETQQRNFAFAAMMYLAPFAVVVVGIVLLHWVWHII